MSETGPQSRQILKMNIEKIIDHTPQVRELILKVEQPKKFQFQAGQFVTLHVPGDPKPVLRAYSIASSDLQTDGFRLLFKYIENGIASTFVWSLKGTETLNFTGPFGRVLFKTPPAQQIIMLSTGTGLSQHLSYLYSKKDLFPDLSYRLLFGIQSEKDIYYREELENLQSEMKNFKFDIVLSNPSPNWKGKSGYVQHFLKEFDIKNIDTHIYLCGNGRMIKDTKQLLIEGENFDKSKIFSEAFD